MKIASSIASCVAFALLAGTSMQAQTVTGSGKRGTVPIWTSSGKLGSSVISEVGDVTTVDGPLLVDTKGGNSVFVTNTTGIGVTGFSESNYGVEGTSNSNVGVIGNSASAEGVKGTSGKKAGVAGLSTTGDGIGGISCAACSGPSAVFGKGKVAGDFEGSVGIAGVLSVVGVKAFHIDHPLDPANKYLNHFSMESDEVLNSYSGNVTTDAGGAATVGLPDYFETLNKDYRYQLTVIGQFAQAIISQEIHGNRFVIKTDKPSVKVSWQVTGVRSDAYVKAHPMPVEQDKPEQERGYYLTPEVFGQPEEKSIAWLYHGYLMRDAKAMEEQREADAAAAQLQRPSVEVSGHD